MPATVAPRDFWDKWHGEPHVDPHVDAPSRAIDPANARRVRRPPSLGRRVARGFGRFVITIGLGVGGTLAWQTYGDTAREMIVAAYPQLDWIAPQSAAPDPAAPAAPATVGSAAPIASPDPQQLDAVWRGLADVRKSVDQLAAAVASGRQQTADEIAKLQTSAQDILGRVSAPPPRATAAAHKPAPLALTPARP